MLFKLVVKYAKDLTTLKIANQRMKVEHLKKHIIHNLANYSNLLEVLEQLLQDTIKGTTEIHPIKKGGKLWMTL